MESISTNTDAQLLENISCFSLCSLELDGSKDIYDVEQLAVWIRGVEENLNITEELLSLRSMHERTRGIDIFGEFLKTVSENNISVIMLSGISTDEALSMLCTGTGFKGQVLKWLAENNVTGVLWCPLLSIKRLYVQKHLDWKMS